MLGEVGWLQVPPRFAAATGRSLAPHGDGPLVGPALEPTPAGLRVVPMGEGGAEEVDEGAMGQQGKQCPPG